MLSHKHRHLTLALLLLIAPFAAQALTPSQVFEKVKDSVVVIKSFNAKGEGISQGSGVLLPSGKVATNCHVVKEGARFQAGRDNSFVPATVFAADPDKDICILQADTLTGTPAQLGKAVTLKVGEAVYAVGAPQGLELSLSNGLVSQLRGGTPPLIQTTAAISQGSSGGGLFDSEARLIGFTTYYYKDGQNLNFAMPVEWLADVKPGKPVSSSKPSQVDWLKQAAALETAQDWPKLLDWTQRWVKAEPQNVIAWQSLGNAQQNLKHYDDAIAVYRQALRINPEYSSAWNNLGNAYHILKRYDDAIAAFRHALRINPEHANAWNNVGAAYNSIKRYDDAIAAFRQALRINPEDADADAWNNVGTSYRPLKRYDDAITSYRQAVRINPKNFISWYNLGITYDNLIRFNDAIDAYREALRINPEYASAWNNLAISYYKSGNMAAALQAVKSLRPFDPAQADILFNLIAPK